MEAASGQAAGEVEVTVAVPVKDRRERMLRCLEDLLAQDHPSFEILVLDNGSTDGTPEACARRASEARVPVRVVRVEGTLGHVRNRGTALARGRYVAFIDSDCSAAPGWLRAGVARLAADPALGLVCGRTLPAEPPLRPWARTVVVEEFSWRFESCNAFFRTSALRESEGFDEVIHDGWEDTAAGFEILRRGWEVAFEPAAVVRHDLSYPGFWWHVRREQRHVNLAHVVGRYPEIRTRLLFWRIFFSPRSAACLAAVVGLPLARIVPPARLLALPYALVLARRLLPHRMLQAAIFDVALHVAILRGAVRHRRLVL